MHAEYLLISLSAFLIFFSILRRHIDAFILVSTAGVLFFLGLAPEISAVLPTIGFCALGWLLARLCRHSTAAWIPGVCIAVAVACFACLKGYLIVPPAIALHGAFTLGLSYVLFRVLHLIIEARTGELDEALRPTRYLAYLLSPFGFISGPIERYPDFARALADARNATIDDRQALAGLGRIAFGTFKVALLSLPMRNYFDRYAAFLDPAKLADAKQFGILLPTVIAQAWHAAGIPDGSALAFEQASLFTIVAPLYFVYLYVNFSGYMDIVIGFGRLCGIAVAENFNHPLRAANVLDFWTRWHMTLSNWFRIYFFNPLLMALMGRFDKANSNLLAVAAYFLTFLVLGIWHGTTPAFVVTGLLLGLGVAANKLFQVWAGSVLGSRRYRELAKRRWYAGLTRGMTFAYISCALVTMWAADEAQLFHLLAVAAAPAFVALSVGAAAAFAIADGAAAIARRAAPLWPAALLPAARVALVSSLLLATILANMVNGLAAQTFVYQGY